MSYNHNKEYSTFIPADVIYEIVATFHEEQGEGTGIYLPRFDYGNNAEIIANLKDLKTGRYPLILLPLPTIKCRKLSFDTVNNFDFDIYIITETNPKYSAAKNKDIFENELYPIYVNFYNALKANKWFRNELRDIEHDQQDLYCLGYEKNSNEINDFVNAIYLSFKNINVNKI